MIYIIHQRGRGGGAGLLLSLKVEALYNEEKIKERARLVAQKEFEEKQKRKQK